MVCMLGLQCGLHTGQSLASPMPSLVSPIATALVQQDLHHNNLHCRRLLFWVLVGDMHSTNGLPVPQCKQRWQRPNPFGRSGRCTVAPDPLVSNLCNAKIWWDTCTCHTDAQASCHGCSCGRGGQRPPARLILSCGAAAPMASIVCGNCSGLNATLWVG